MSLVKRPIPILRDCPLQREQNSDRQRCEQGAGSENLAAIGRRVTVIGGLEAAIRCRRKAGNTRSPTDAAQCSMNLKRGTALGTSSGGADVRVGSGTSFLVDFLKSACTSTSIENVKLVMSQTCH